MGEPKAVPMCAFAKGTTLELAPKVLKGCIHLIPRECLKLLSKPYIKSAFRRQPQREVIRCVQARRRRLMSKIVLAIGAAAVALTAVPAAAREYSNTIACSGWRNGQCVAWNRLTREQERKIAVGTVF